MPYRWGFLAVLLVAIGIAVYFVRTPKSSATSNELLVEAGPRRGFVTSADCRSCHDEQHASWHDSYHRTMTQEVSPETVVASFDDVSLATYGQTAHLERRGDEFWVEMADPEALLASGGTGVDPATLPRVERRVVLATGSHHFQAYWTRGGQGRELVLFPWRYHIATKRWMHRRDVFVQPLIDDPRVHHKVWNGDCIDCHTTGEHPGIDVFKQSFEWTAVAEFGIACEACHGPGRPHVELASQVDEGTVDQSDVTDWKIMNPMNADARTASQICAQCHSDSVYINSNYAEVGQQFKPGDELLEIVRLTKPEKEDPAYWSDGVCRGGGREYNAMMLSQCHMEGAMSCLSCHSMHRSDPDDQLGADMRSNEACFQCHESFRENVEAHTHHPPESSGSLCYNCHMPYTSFALLKGIRSHRVGSPRIRSIAPDSQPNACNLCHANQTLAWSSERMTEWYQHPSAELSQDERSIAASLLWLLRGDAAQRAVAAWHMGWDAVHQTAGNGWIAPHLAQLLNDDYAANRWVAQQSLRSLPGFERFEFAFDGAVEQRAKAVEEVLAQWRKAQAEDPAAGSPEVLMSTTGRWQVETVRRLLQQQDKRRIMIFE